MKKLGGHGETIGHLFGLPIVVDENLGKALPPIVTLSAGNLAAAELDELRKKWERIVSSGNIGHAIICGQACIACNDWLGPMSDACSINEVWPFCGSCFLSLTEA